MGQINGKDSRDRARDATSSGNSRSSSRRDSPGPIGGGSSYGMSDRDFDRTIGRDHGGSERERDRNDRERNTSSGSGSSAPAAAEPDRRAVDPNAGRRAPQYGRYSTPGPIGGPQSYGLQPGSPDFDKISDPHQPESPDRYENWARDVLARNEEGQAPTPRERERLESGLSGYRGQQVADVASTVAGLANPYAGLAVQGAFGLASNLASPEFQAGAAAAGSPTTTGTVGNVVGQAAGALGNPGLATAANVVGSFGTPIEQSFSPTGQLYDQIGNFLGSGADRAQNAFGGDNRDNDNGYGYGATDTTTGTMSQATQPQYSAADPFYYQTFLDLFRG